MNANIAAVLYLISGVLFILALRGLSHPETSRRGNHYGMVGMGIAVLTTLAVAAPSASGWFWIILAIAVLIVAVWGFYVWYQNRRARESFKDIDYSKLNDLDEDGWDDN